LETLSPLRRAALAAACLAAAAPVHAADVGEPAPDVSLQELRGDGEVKLDSLRGKVVVMDFWATWCAPCVEQLEQLSTLSRDLGGGKGKLEVVATSIDADSEAPTRYAAERLAGAPIRLLHDPDASGLGALGAESIPAIYVIDGAGVIRAHHHGPGGVPAVRGTVEKLLEAGPSEP
jgi:peroxiredoxin